MICEFSLFTKFGVMAETGRHNSEKRLNDSSPDISSHFDLHYVTGSKRIIRFGNEF